MKRDLIDVKYDTEGFWTFLNLHSIHNMSLSTERWRGSYGTCKEKEQFGYYCKVMVLDLYSLLRDVTM